MVNLYINAKTKKQELLISNKQISAQLMLASALMELHDENPFKSKSYNSASQIIDNSVDYTIIQIGTDA